jgi:hypothetical protein
MMELVVSGKSSWSCEQIPMPANARRTETFKIATVYLRGNR